MSLLNHIDITSLDTDKQLKEALVQEVILNFSHGHEKSFRFLYERYASSLRYFAGKYLNSEEGRDDVVQDAFVSLWEQRFNFNSENAIKAFLYKTVKNSSLNIIRHRSVKDRYEVAVMLEDNYDSFLENILQAEVFELVVGVFNQLSPAAREVYKLSLDGMSHEEIAEKLHISINTVKKHKNNANHYMRRKLGDILLLLVYISRCK